MYLCFSWANFIIFAIVFLNFLKLNHMRSFLRCVALSVACSFAASAAQAQSSNAFTLRGAIDKGVESDSVILAKVTTDGLLPLDTTVYHKGAFSFSGTVDGIQLLFLVGLKNGVPSYGSDVVVEPGQLWVRLYKEAGRTIEAPKSVSNALWRSFSDHESELVQQIKPYVQAYKTQKLSEVDKRLCLAAIDSLNAARSNNVVSFIKGNSKSQVADLVFSMYYGLLDDSALADVSAVLAKNTPQRPVFAAALAKIEVEKQQKRLAPGGTFIDFSMTDKDGNMVKVSDIVKANKVTLIDFWASWCGPCRMEMPVVKRAYEFFHSKGLEVVGVSLDSNRKSWLGAVEQLGLNWIHLSDLKGWQCSAAKTYGVHSIPGSYLVAQDGTIIAKNLRGEQLIQTLLKVLN